MSILGQGQTQPRVMARGNSAIIVIYWLIFEDVPGSSVSILTRLPFYKWRIFVYFSMGTEIFQFFTLPRPTLGLTQLSDEYTGFLGVSGIGMPDHSPQSSAKGKGTKTLAVPLQCTVDCSVNRLPFLIH